MSIRTVRHVTLGLSAIALLCLGGIDLIAAEPGNVTLASQAADSVTLTNGSDRVLVKVLKPNLLQVNYRPGNQASPNTLILDPVLATKSWTPGPVNIADGTNEIVLTTTAMVVRIGKSPCRINVYQTDGATRIFGEPSDGGMPIGGSRSSSTPVSTGMASSRRRANAVAISMVLPSPIMSARPW